MIVPLRSDDMVGFAPQMSLGTAVQVMPYAAGPGTTEHKEGR
jgi:hypothetical protein